MCLNSTLLTWALNALMLHVLIFIYNFILCLYLGPAPALFSPPGLNFSHVNKPIDIQSNMCIGFRRTIALECPGNGRYRYSLYLTLMFLGLSFRLGRYGHFPIGRRYWCSGTNYQYSQQQGGLGSCLQCNLCIRATSFKYAELAGEGYLVS